MSGGQATYGEMEGDVAIQGLDHKWSASKPICIYPIGGEAL